jgi:hypothetical protein
MSSLKFDTWPSLPSEFLYSLLQSDKIMCSISLCNADLQFFGKSGWVAQTSISRSNHKDYSEVVKSGERTGQCILYRQNVKLCGPKSMFHKKSPFALPRGRWHHPAESTVLHFSPFVSLFPIRMSNAVSAQRNSAKMHGKNLLVLLQETRSIHTKREFFPSGFPPKLGTLFSFL